MNGFNKITLAAFSWFFLMKSADAIEFNTDVLDAMDKNNVDLSRFSNADYVMPGKYLLNIFLNNQSISNSEQQIIFYQSENEKTAICFPAELTQHLGMTEDAMDKVFYHDKNGCADFSALDGMELKADTAVGALYLNAPQAYLEYSDESWLPPSRWDDGINGFIWDYNLNAGISRSHKGYTSNDYSISGTTGVNLGSWRLRGDYQGNYSDSSAELSNKHNFDWTRIYAYRAITRLRSTITIGETYFRSDLFDSFRFTGLSFASDERMLPPNLRGYAPEVRGIAKTNATVTITQQDRIIYETTVPSGPFRIRDLNSAVTGKLNVRVKEQDGTEQTFTVDTANIPYLTRPGSIRFKVAVGRPSNYDHRLRGDYFGSGEFSWGVANSLSLYGGGVLTKDYNSISVGIGRDLYTIGALSADLTQSYAKIPEIGNKSGKSWRLSYSKRFDDYDSEVTFAGYRFSQRDYMSMGQFLDAKHYERSSGRNKEMYTINANKNFTDARLSTYVTYTRQNYWDRPSEESYNFSISRYFDFLDHKNLSVNISADRSKYNMKTDDRIFISLTVPLGSGETFGYNGQSISDNYSQSISYSNHLDVNNNYRLAAGMNSKGSHDVNSIINGYYTHIGDMAELSVNASYSQNEYSSAGLSIQGGVTATSKGAALHPSGLNGGTRLMLSTDGISGVPIDGGSIRSNYYGIAVQGNMSSYYRTDTRIDINQISDDVDATKSVVESTLTDGAIGYREFRLLRGERVFAYIKMEDGEYPPFGSIVSNSQGRELAIVSDNGQAYISGFVLGDKLDVKWGGGKHCQITMPVNIQLSANLLLPCVKVGEEK